MNSRYINLMICILFLSGQQQLSADPCGLVPPIVVNKDKPEIQRVGAQLTYAFFRNGIESIVIRPEFSGELPEFGMLIPLPSVPSIRKVDDDIFEHIAASIDPPEVKVDMSRVFGGGGMGGGGGFGGGGMQIQRDEVRVVKEEAIGMYNVVVLNAGSARALNLWMTSHGYKYPEGMDLACEDYIRARWCFVAVKAKIAAQSDIEPRPGLRAVRAELPENSTYEGAVQGMGFRFRSTELIIPMRLSTFNEGELRNIVYVLTDRPIAITGLPKTLVRRQLKGSDLSRNLARPLSLRVVNSGPYWYNNRPWDMRRQFSSNRNPSRVMARAAELYAFDIAASQSQQLSNKHEEVEKELQKISERLGLSGPAADSLHRESLSRLRRNRSLDKLANFTMTVIDGDFPRDFIARTNLRFERYVMPPELNTSERYNAQDHGPQKPRKGLLITAVDPVHWTPPTAAAHPFHIITLLALCGFLAVPLSNRLKRVTRAPSIAMVVIIAMVAIGSLGSGQDGINTISVRRLVQQLGNPDRSHDATSAIIARGDKLVPYLVRSLQIEKHPTRRGWIIVCLHDIGTPTAMEGLKVVLQNNHETRLLRVWAGAGLIHPNSRAQDYGDLMMSTDLWDSQLLVDFLEHDADPAKLVHEMLAHQNSDVRRRLAGCVASMDNTLIPDEILEQLHCTPNAKKVPWTGGALFLPSLAWDKQQSKVLVREFMTWLVWCHVSNPKENRGPIERVLVSPQFEKETGYRWANRVSPASILQRWKSIVGPAEVADLFDQFKVPMDDPLRHAVLDL